MPRPGPEDAALTDPVEREAETQPRDVVNAYRAFLGRNPENDAVIAANLRRGALATAAVLARSPEFRVRLRDMAADRLTPHAALPPEELEDAWAWAHQAGLLDAPPAGGASPALLLAGLLAAPAVAAELRDPPDDLRAALVRLHQMPPGRTALHLLTRPAEAADARALDLILAGAAAEEPVPPPPFPPLALHRLIAGRLGRPEFQAGVLRALGTPAPLPVFGLDPAAAEECAAWLGARLGAPPGEPLVLGGLLAALLRAPAVDDLLRRLWPAEHAAAMGALPGLGAGRHQLQALRAATEDVGLAYLSVLGRPPEATGVRRAHEGAPLSQMLTTLLASGEFRAHVLGRLAGGEAVPHHGLAGEQRRQVGRWLSARIGIPARPGAPAPLHPMALLARLLSLPALEEELARLHGALWQDARAALRSWLEAGGHEVLGAIDYVTGDWIAGWALDRDAAAPLEIEVRCNGRLVAAGRADRPRPGAAEEEGAAAACGFRLPWRGRGRSGLLSGPGLGPGPGADVAGGYRFQIHAARSGEPVGPPFQLDSVFVEPRSTLQMIAQELRQARATLDRLERMMPQLESFTGFPPEEHAAFRRAHRLLPPPPLALPLPPVRVVVPGRGVSVRGWRRILHALQGQAGAVWSAVLLAATPEQAALAGAAAARDPRFIPHALPADAPQAELAAEREAVQVCPGGTLALLLPPGALPGADCALAWFAHAAARLPDSPAFFCDEDSVAEAFREGPDTHSAPVFRGVLDPWMLPAANPCGETLCARPEPLAAALARAEGCGDRAAQRWVAWAALAAAGPVAHIPRLLVSRQPTETEAAEAGPVPEAALRPLLRHPWLLPGTEPGAGPGAPGAEAVLSVIVPTRNGGALVEACLGSLLEKAAAPERLELLVVDNGSDEAGTLALLAAQEARGTRVLRMPEPFNWSRLNNRAARAASGALLLFLNDDTRMLTPGWDALLRRLLAEPEVGAVGARLAYEDLTLQHAGVIFGVEGLAAHEGVGAALEEGGPGGRWQALRQAGAVTGAFLGCRREAFERLGGFDEHAFGVTFNDVDFCLRLRAAGLAVLYEPRIALVHYESKSRGLDDLDAAKQERAEFERRRLAERWGAGVLLDPGFNPHWSRWTRPFAAIREPSAAEIAAHLAASASADPWNPLLARAAEEEG